MAFSGGKLWKRVGLFLGAGGSLAIGSAGVWAYQNRPHPDHGQEDFTGDAPVLDAPPQGTLARKIVIGGVSWLSLLYLTTLNKFEIYGQEKLVEAVTKRKERQGLITVSNHTSTLDDPALIACSIPRHVILRPDLMRWSVCSQEICFSNSILAAFFGAGQTLPIKRGAGVDQSLLRGLFDRLEHGRWVHLFPEGGTFQIGRLGGRAHDQKREIGRLKWGVGKLIAEASITPIVVPFYHTGMHDIMPQHPETKKLLVKIPRTGQRVTMHVGEPIHFDDLMDKYREKRGSERRKITAARQVTRAWPEALEVVGEEDAFDPWHSTEVDRELYSAITRRIERELEKLELEALEHLHQMDEEKQNLGGQSKPKISVTERKEKAKAALKDAAVDAYHRSAGQSMECGTGNGSR